MSSSRDPFNIAIVEEFTHPPFPRRSAYESRPTDRLRLIRGRDQDALEQANFWLIGTGANSIAAMGLVRSGATRIVMCDGDFFDMSNFNRQLGRSADRGRPKAHRVARNLGPEAVNGVHVTAIALPFPQAITHMGETPDIIVCLVDDNQCREDVSRFALEHGIPAVIAGLGVSGLQSYAFLQDPRMTAMPCIRCVYPEMTPVRAACVAASIKTVFMAAGHMLHFIDVALMGWGDVPPYNLRLADLNGEMEFTSLESRRTGCSLCGGAPC